jgi:hypothetical protein
MRIRLYIDEDAMDRDLVNALRQRGVDILTALDAALIGHPDNEHLAFAASEFPALYSYNVGDFAALHRDFVVRGKHHSGIILARQQTFSVGEQMRRLLRLMGTRTDLEMRNTIEYLGSW